jgi:hypothetical protein
MHQQRRLYFMMITTRHSLLFPACLLLAALAVPSTPAAASSRGTSVTTTLRYGVTCTTSTTVINLGSSPGNSSTFHEVRCNQTVGRIHVNAAQSNETNGAYYFESETCYNTNYCSEYISDKWYQEGEWVMDTSGIVGTTANHSYYGVTQNANKWISCYNGYCSF